MKNSYQISIIIPAFNEEKYLALCLKSLKELNWPKEYLEIIVVDNGSTDRTREIAKQFGVILLRDDTKNVSGLRNLGAKRAKGHLLVFLDSDCIVPEDWLKNATVYMENPEVVVWGGPPVPPKTASWVQKAWFQMVDNPYETREVDWIGSVDLFVEKKWFERVGGFNDAMLTCEDVDLCYKIKKHGKIISDSNLSVIHLREADTIKEFFNKEVWRGKGNMSGLLSHGFSMRELPSLLVPFYFFSIIPIILVTFWISSFLLSLSVLIVFFSIPPLLALFKTSMVKSKLSLKLQLCVLIYVYFAARSYSLFKSRN